MRPTTGTAELIVRSVIDRMISQFNELNESTCFLCDEPEPPDFSVPRGDVFCTVHGGDGQFDKMLFDGGGIYTCAEVWNITVTLFRLTRADSLDQSTKALLDRDRGMLGYKRKILRAMLVDWIPTLSDGTEMTRGGIWPIDSASPSFWKYQSGMYSRVGVRFGVMFDWELVE